MPVLLIADIIVIKMNVDPAWPGSIHHMEVTAAAFHAKRGEYDERRHPSGLQIMQGDLRLRQFLRDHVH